jgi:ribokinase
MRAARSLYCVVGSLNMDMVTRVPRFPGPGETIAGRSFAIYPGGKGANQAVALARLGASVEMVGAIGNDVLGSRCLETLDAEGVGRRMLRVGDGEATGTASIEVSDSGENHIVVVAGANGAVSPSMVAAARELIEACDFTLLQLEIPIEAVVEAALIAHAAGRAVILDPAPALDLPPELYPLVSVITPNETEAAILTGEDTSDESGIVRAGKALLERGVDLVVVKAGRRGAYLFGRDGWERVEGFEVLAVDTVAAGDSFNAGLAYALGAGNGLPGALRFANAVAAISTTRAGAQAAMPSLAEAEALLAR